jgi:hypothetical protein
MDQGRLKNMAFRSGAMRFYGKVRNGGWWGWEDGIAYLGYVMGCGSAGWHQPKRLILGMGANRVAYRDCVVWIKRIEALDVVIFGVSSPEVEARGMLGVLDDGGMRSD